MKRTRIQLETAPNSMFGILTLIRALEKFERIAEGVEKELQSYLEPGQWIVWRMTYNWKPDDGESGRDMAPEYQPILFSNVYVVNKFGWQEAVCAMTLNIDCFAGQETVGCTLDNCDGNSVLFAAENIIPRISSDLKQFMNKQKV